jgi:hypothetical protein
MSLMMDNIQSLGATTNREMVRDETNVSTYILNALERLTGTEPQTAALDLWRRPSLTSAWDYLWLMSLREDKGIRLYE